jgi:hypothetical protein
MRPRCDPFDTSAIRAAIASGATTERRAYETYAATAARPYARSSWGVMLRSRKAAAEMHREVDPRHSSGRLNGSKSGAPVKPSNVLTLTGDSLSLSVKRGALIAARDPMTLVYESRAVEPSAIVMTGWGGVITCSVALLRQAQSRCCHPRLGQGLHDRDGASGAAGSDDA